VNIGRTFQGVLNSRKRSDTKLLNHLGTAAFFGDRVERARLIGIAQLGLEE